MELYKKLHLLPYVKWTLLWASIVEHLAHFPAQLLFKAFSIDIFQFV